METEKHPEQVFIPDAKKYLEQVRLLEKVVNLKTDELRGYYEMAQKVTTVYSDMPGSPNRNISGMENVMAKILDAEKELTEEIDRLIDMKREVSSVIDCVEDIQHRTVLMNRYVLLLNWKAISVRMDMDVRSIYRFHRAGLEDVQKILEKNLNLSANVIACQQLSVILLY